MTGYNLCFLFILFIANMLNGFLPEYGSSGGWEYSIEEANQDCLEFKKVAKIYRIDEYRRVHFICMK